MLRIVLGGGTQLLYLDCCSRNQEAEKWRRRINGWMDGWSNFDFEWLSLQITSIEEYINWSVLFEELLVSYALLFQVQTEHSHTPAAISLLPTFSSQIH